MTPTSKTLASQRWLVVAAWPPELIHLRRERVGLPAKLRRRLALGTVGVGLVEAAAGGARLLAEQKPDGVLLVGTAGAYPGGPAIGSAVLAGTCRLLVQLLGPEHGYVPSIIPTEAASAPALLRALSTTTALDVADVACPLAITASTKAARAAAAASGCAVENLEAFAVARAAAAARIPFAAVLGISNRVGPNAHAEWKANAKAAARTACEAVLTLLRRG